MMNTRAAGAILVMLLTLACAAEPGADDPERAAAAGRVIDAWHAAASRADEAAYFGLMTADAVFLGTDAGERWTVEEFRAYAQPYFSEGRGWTYVPSERHLTFSADGRLAWFDERLASEKYGVLRGTGVLRLTGDQWKIAHYSMTFTVPNDVAADVVERIRGNGG